MSHEARMMLLFASAGNPLWKDLISGDITENKIADYLGIVRITLTNWKKTESLGRKPEDLFGTVKDHIRQAAKPAYLQRGSSRAGLTSEIAERALAKVDEFHGLFRSSRYPHIYEAANVLGIGVKDCQQIIDHSHYTQLPLFPKMLLCQQAGMRQAFQSICRPLPCMGQAIPGGSHILVQMSHGGALHPQDEGRTCDPLQAQFPYAGTTGESSILGVRWVHRDH